MFSIAAVSLRSLAPKRSIWGGLAIACIVVFMNTYMSPQIVPAGWLEWVHNGEPSLPTVSYAEYTRRAQARIRRTRFVCQATDCRPSGQAEHQEIPGRR